MVLYKNRQLVIYQRKLKTTKNELEDTLKTFRSLVNLTIEGIIIVSKNEIIYYNDEVLKYLILMRKLLSRPFSNLFETDKTITFEDIIKNSDSLTYEISWFKEF